MSIRDSFLLDLKLTLEQVRKAKAKVLAEPKIPTVGVGIVQKDGVFGLKINVSKSADVPLVPKRIGNVPVHEVVIVGGIHPLRVKG